LPVALWKAACGADGGSIKPYDRDITGIGYIKSWKQAVKQRVSLLSPDRKLRWHPSVSIWAGVGDGSHKPDEIQKKGAALFSPRYSHLRQKLYDAFKRLIPEQLDRSNTIRPIYTFASFLDAAFLYMNRRELPFNLYIFDQEDSRFLRSASQEQLPNLV
jgi:hypothetical protein